MTAPITAARTGGLSFRIGGIPVTIHLTFLLVIGFLGFGIGDVQYLLVWVGTATAAVLLHELGHAVVGRLAGLTPRIDLAGFGGVTSWAASPRGQLGRGWSLAISLAGPGAGFLGGGVALLLGAPCCGVPVGAGLPAFAAGVWLFASFAWGLLNLLPILPLDGGQALRELLPGDRVQRVRRAAAVGVVVGGLLVAWALTTGAVFLALIAGWITWSNVQQVQGARELARESEPGSATSLVTAVQDAARAGDAPAVVARSAELADVATDPRTRQFAVLMHVQGLLSTGRTAAAYRTVADPRRDVDLPTELVGAVVARHPDLRAVDTVARGWAASGSREGRGLAAVVLAAHGHHDEVATLLANTSSGPDGEPIVERGSEPIVERGSEPIVERRSEPIVERGSEPIVDAGVAVAVQTAAHRDGAVATAAAIGQALLRGGSRSPVLAYNTACSMARAGRVDDAVATLSQALRLGFSDLDLLAGDDDLAPLHDHPAWPRLRTGEPVSH